MSNGFQDSQPDTQTPDTLQSLLPQNMLDRLKSFTIVPLPLDAGLIDKVVDRTNSKMLQGRDLNDRQRAAAVKFLHEKTTEGFDPSHGLRAIRQRAKNAFTSAAFGALMHEHSTETLLRGMMDEFRGTQSAMTAPATARFKKTGRTI